MKNICCRLLALMLIPLCISCAVTATPAARPRSVILLIGDGMGFAQIKAYRYYADDPSTPSIDPLPADPAYGVDGVAAYGGINQLLSQRTLTGWSTTGHTGVDVPLYAVGPGSENFHGLMQNEEVGRRLQSSFLP